MTSPTGDAAALGAQLLAWGQRPEVWLLAALALGSLCTSITGARLAHHTGRSVLPWVVIGLIPVLGPLWIAFLAGAPGREVVRRLDRIEDFLVRGIPPERLQALLAAEPTAKATATLATEAPSAGGEPRPQGASPPRATLEPEGSRPR